MTKEQEAVEGCVSVGGHTPGPWVVGTDRERRTIIGGPVVVAVAGNMGCDSGYPQSERRPHVKQAQANARLIAAAPTMLAALKNTTDTLAYLKGEDWETIKKARAAITLATQPGEEQ